MNEDLKKFFNERNKEILNNKIKLDIDNNTDSLKLTINNVISLEMNKLHKSIINFCEECNILYNIQEINETIEEEKKNLEEMTASKLQERKENIEKGIFGNNKDLDKDDLKGYTDIMLDDIKVNISKENAINFLPNITNKLNLKNEEDLIRLNSLVRLEFNIISNRIENNTRTRFINLCNMIEESRQISDDYSKKTGDAIEKISSTKKPERQYKSTKKKIKKAA